MQRLSTLLATDVRDVEGRPLGRPSDVVADRSAKPPVVCGFVVHHERVPLPDAVLPAPAEELLLVRDVLDVQVLDRAGRHCGRVGDVQLAQDPGGRLVVTAVETGLSPVLRRLGLGRAATHVDETVVPWADLHAKTGRAHAYQTELPPSRRYRGVMHARRRPPA